MMLMRLAMLWISVAVTQDVTQGVLAEVIVAETDVYAEPSASAYLCVTLNRGARVLIQGATQEGWTEIAPVPESIDWIDQSALSKPIDQGANVILDRALVRVGRRDARLPGPSDLELRKGDVVRLVPEVPPLTIRRSGRSSTLVAIQAPARGVRYIRSNAIRKFSEPTSSRDAEVRTVDGTNPPLPPEVADELIRIDASRRSMLREALENWNFGPVLKRYQDLLKTTSDPTAQSVISGRIAQVTKDAEFADRSRRFADLLKKSRRRDGDLRQVRSQLNKLRADELEAYTAIGLVQPSSKEIEGRRLHVLIGEDGATAAYLDIPPGVDLEGMMTRRVGVRGALRYNEKLSARVITVRDIEALGKKD